MAPSYDLQKSQSRVGKWILKKYPRVPRSQGPLGGCKRLKAH